MRPRGGTPPLVPMWPGVRVIEKNPFPFFPFNPQWQKNFSRREFELFCAMLKLAWTSERPCYLPPDRGVLKSMLGFGTVEDMMLESVLSRFHVNQSTGLIFFPPQLRALQRLVNGADMYALLWDESNE